MDISQFNLDRQINDMFKGGYELITLCVISRDNPFEALFRCIFKLKNTCAEKAEPFECPHCECMVF